MNDLLTLSEACEMVDCAESTLLMGLRSGDYPGVKVGRTWVIPRSAFIQRLNEKALENTRKRAPKPQSRGRRPLAMV